MATNKQTSEQAKCIHGWAGLDLTDIGSFILKKKFRLHGVKQEENEEQHG